MNALDFHPVSNPPPLGSVVLARTKAHPGFRVLLYKIADRDAVRHVGRTPIFSNEHNEACEEDCTGEVLEWAALSGDPAASPADAQSDPDDDPVCPFCRSKAEVHVYGSPTSWICGTTLQEWKQGYHAVDPEPQQSRACVVIADLRRVMLNTERSKESR